MSPELLARFRLTAEEWAELPPVLQRRYTARFEREQSKAEAKKKEDHEKWSRRFHREMVRRSKVDDEYAQCGIRWYCRSPHDRATGNYWRTCHSCGQQLIYTSDPNAKPQVCKANAPLLDRQAPQAQTA